MPRITFTYNQGPTNYSIDGVGMMFDLTRDGTFPDPGTYTVTHQEVTIKPIRSYNSNAQFLLSSPGHPDLYGSQPMGIYGFNTPNVDYKDGITFAIDGFVPTGGDWNAISQVKLEKYNDTNPPTYGTYVFSLRGGGSIQIFVDYEMSNSPTGAPSSVTVSPTVSEGNVVLEWSGAAAGVQNAITAYEVEYCDSPDNNNWGAWLPYDTFGTPYTSGAVAVAPPDTRGYYRTFRIRTQGTAGASYYSEWAHATNSVQRQPATPPSAPWVQVDPTLSGETTTIAWGGSQPGYGNEIDSIMVAYQDSPDGVNWTETATIGQLRYELGSVAVAANPTEGHYRVYHILVIGSGGLNSTWSTTAAVRRNSTPTPPTSFVASPSVLEYPTSNVVTLNWSGATDVDNNILLYTIQWAFSADGVTWNEWQTLAHPVSPPIMYNHGFESSNAYMKWRICTVDSYSLSSSWLESNVVRRNIIPGQPVITVPANNAQTYSTHPRVRVYVPAEPDGNVQELLVQANGGAWTVLQGALPAAETHYWYVPPTLNVGMNTLNFALRDELGGVGTISTVNIHVLAPLTWTDPSITPGQTYIKAAHLNEIRSAVNVTCRYYGIAEIPAQNIVPNQTSISHFGNHINQIRTALDNCFYTIGGTPPTWTNDTNGTILAWSVLELRNYVDVI